MKDPKEKMIDDFLKELADKGGTTVKKDELEKLHSKFQVMCLGCKGNNVVLHVANDYTGCYYEGDYPESFGCLKCLDCGQAVMFVE